MFLYRPPWQVNMAFTDDITAAYNSFVSGPFADMVLAIVIFSAGFVVGKLLGRIVTRLLHEIEFNKIMSSAGVNLPLEETIGNIVSYIIYFLSVIFALTQFEFIAGPILYVVATAIVVLIIVSTLLAVKDFIPNFFAGIFLLRSGILKKGNYIKFGTTEGEVVDISLIETQLENKDGDLIFVPNSLISKNKVTLVRKGLKN